MGLHDHIMGNGQALPRTDSYLFGGEKRFENSILDFFRNTSPIVINHNNHTVRLGVVLGGDYNLAFLISGESISYGMSAVNDQVKNHLVDFTDIARHHR